MKPVVAEISEKGDRIETKSAWYPEAPSDAKSIKGYRWNKASARWSYPLSLETCHRLREVYGERLETIGPRLSSWAREEIRRQKELSVLGSATDADLLAVPHRFPRMAEAMANRTYQRSGARFIAVGRKVGVFDEVGLGKTITAIAGVIEAGKFSGRHLVIANKTALRSVWEDQIDMWTDGQATTFVAEGTLVQRKKVLAEFDASEAESKWLIVNPKMLEVKLEEYCPKCKRFTMDMDQNMFGDDHAALEHFTMAHKTEHRVHRHKYPEFQARPWDSITIDEAHKILTTGNKGTKKTKKTQVALGIDMLEESTETVKMALTGTPVRGKEQQLWGVLNWLDPKKFSTYWGWVNRYFEIESNGFGSVITGLKTADQDAFWQMIDDHALRRTRREVRADLPQSESYTEWVPLEGKHLKQYTEFLEQGMVALESGTLIADGHLSELTRLRQMAYGVWDIHKNGHLAPTEDSPKFTRLLDILEEHGVTGSPSADFYPDGQHYKYIIATQFTQVADVLEQALSAKSIKTLKITGAVTGAKRAAAVRSFQDDPMGPRVLIMNTYAGGESITLDRYCDTMFILDETFVGDDQAQLYGRIDNRSVSAQDAVPRRFIHIQTRSTIDQVMAEQNLSQMEREHEMFDARRGVELAKMFMRKDMQWK